MIEQIDKALEDSIKRTISVYNHNLSIGSSVDKLQEIATTIATLVNTYSLLKNVSTTSPVMARANDSNVFTEEIEIDHSRIGEKVTRQRSPVISNYYYEDGFAGKRNGQSELDYFRDSI